MPGFLTELGFEWLQALLTPYGTKALVPASKNEPNTFNPHIFLLSFMPGEEERMKMEIPKRQTIASSQIVPWLLVCLWIVSMPPPTQGVGVGVVGRMC